MSAVTLERFDDVSAWRARRPNGSASTAIGITAGAASREGTGAAVVSAGTGAAGHYVERTGPAVDLREMADLQLWVRGDRPASGSTEQPFYAEVRAGAAGAAVGSDGNGWHRFVPVTQSGAWQPVLLSLTDLPDAVRAGLTTLRITSLVPTAWSLTLDPILAVRDDMVLDADDALRARLDGRLTIDGTPVPADVVPMTPPPAASTAWFRISNYDVQPDLARTSGVGPRTDYTADGFTQRPPAVPYRLYYAVEAVAPNRADAARMLDFVLGELAPTSSLSSRGRPLTVDWVDAPATAAAPVVAPPADHPVVHLRVATSRAGRAAPERAVPVYNVLTVEVDHRARS